MRAVFEAVEFFEEADQFPHFVGGEVLAGFDGGVAGGAVADAFAQGVHGFAGVGFAGGGTKGAKPPYKSLQIICLCKYIIYNDLQSGLSPCVTLLFRQPPESGIRLTSYTMSFQSTPVGHGPADLCRSQNRRERQDEAHQYQEYRGRSGCRGYV